MIRVRIGGTEKDERDVKERWINEQLSRRREDYGTACVQVTIHKPPLHMVLSTPGCSSGGGGGRPPNSQEQSIFALWDRHKLNSSDFKGGNLIAFLKQVS